MIKARHTRFHYWFFKHFSRIGLKRQFHTISLQGDMQAENGAVVLIGNHFSWWDGFIAQVINLKIWNKKLHIMMLENELRHRMFLRKTGAFGIAPGTRDAVASIVYSKQIIQNPDNLLVLYPQGKINSIYNADIQFEKGWTKILKNAPELLNLYFYAALTDYFSHGKPELSIYLKKIHDFDSSTDFQKLYQDFYTDAVTQQTKKV